MTRRVGFWVAILAALLLVAVALGPPARDGEPLDPRSTGPDGARGLVLVLEELGASVSIGERVPGDGTDVALVLTDRLRDDQHDRLLGWARLGGTLVVADPGSPLHQADRGFLGGAVVDEGTIGQGLCDLTPLAGAGEIEVDGAAAFERDAGATGCYGDEELAAVVAVPTGRGVVVSIGAPSLLVNDRFDEASNAVVAAALLAPAPGTTVAIVERAVAGSGDDTLADLVPDRVLDALLQLAIAFCLYALWRARRLGRPVAEPQPVQIEGSELVVAVGNLLRRSKDPDRAAALLRRGLERQLAGRSGVDRDALTEVLERPVRSDAELLALARDIDRIRQEAIHAS